MEWFDYAAYGYLAVTIAAVFFPSDDRQLALLMTFGVFAISFLVRPLGGFVWGHLGDRIGRKEALSWSILLMSGATFCIALLPGYASIGIGAPLLLLALRLVQGFSASGEYAGASAFLVEYAPANRRGLYAAVVPASTATGLLLGSLLAALLTGPAPGRSDGALGLAHSLRAGGPDGPDRTLHPYEAGGLAGLPSPVSALFREHWRRLLLAAGAVLLNAVGFYVILSYMPTYLSEELHLDATRSYLATTVALVTYIGFIFITGMLSDKFGRKRVLMSASILFVLFTVPAFMLLDTGNFLLIILVQILLGAMLTLNDGTLPSYLAEMFPTRVRYSGFAVSFNLSNALFGGTAPFMATLLIAASGNLLAPGWYLMAAAVVSLIAVACSVETSRKPLT
ncbi:MFS transporter [Glutamicibacter creatinolyticus]|uniref:MFS transporter n=1 Tax=Glutamicibacter creatinolyticus TaxID=162496 RepID=A0A5B7WYJ4_9MICC|nr:MFS transporter [Glutamicibacter creatinolyticus]QCY48485.1 MFS transporter [Glutamicibacter creatinolyticus]